MKKLILLSCICISLSAFAFQTKKIPITIENNTPEAPITIGIPFPMGELFSVDNIRLLNAKGQEITCQTTEVSTWEPIDQSVKWVWVFFFSDDTSEYTLEYGEQITAKRPETKIVSVNNMRSGGGIFVNTGPLSLTIKKSGNGFLDKVLLDSNGNGKFEEDELLASSTDYKRGVFLDILDDAGIDMSTALIHEVFREKGSGPMHAIFRIEGTLVYKRKDNNNSPFTIILHAYAGKSYVKILHTLTYTGIPDKHKIQEGQHANIATQNKKIISEDTAEDKGWTQPNDQIASCGLKLKYHLNPGTTVSMPLYEGKWNESDRKYSLKKIRTSERAISLVQEGPERGSSESLRDYYMNKEKKIKDASTTKKVQFRASVSEQEKQRYDAEKAKGWLNISDEKRGVSVGIKNFLKEYPKGIQVDPSSQNLIGSVWPSDTEPMGFARANTKLDGGMLDNFAQGITKTTEFIYYFHKGASDALIGKTMDYVVNAPVAHATSEWYANSKVYGNMAPYSKKHPEFENSLQYKYQWYSYNQDNEPWYGMFDYGDGKTYYINDKWYQWTNNEPTVDFMLWTNFMRTGKLKYFQMAQAMSRHTMDVDNVHWPKKREYVGGINDAVDYWNFLDEPESTPYLGIGRRHANEHWNALLSAHVWIQGWIASYYLTGDHRALEVAKMTGDTYIKRIWGEHGLRGRRLYLSVLNLVELYDATKLDKYKTELDFRVKIMLDLQKTQGGNLLLDRYGYSQTYAVQGLYKYHQITGEKGIKKALVAHARWVRDVPPLNHEMESYLATIYPLLLGYEFSGQIGFFQEALDRAKVLKVVPLSKEIDDFKEVQALSEALLNVSNMPKSDRRFTNWEINQGLRVFGWTHAYNVPYLLYWLEHPKTKNTK
ncbi:hypothetical protein N9954_00675 [Maribacter sp.]|nr:hypothetical protein [Maribacter sp.]